MPPFTASRGKNRLLKTAANIDEHFLVDTSLHDTPDLVIYRTEICMAVWRPQVGRQKVWRFLTQQFNCCMIVKLGIEINNRHCKQVN